MNPDPQKLEATIHQVLRALPGRKAPSGLEGRVFAELARRAALPWWRKSFAHWPVAVRAGFFVGSAAAAGLLVSAIIVLGRSTGAHEVAGSISNSFAWIVFTRDLVTTLDQKVLALIAAIPRLWLYGAVGTIAVSYAALAAIGAVAYRALSSARQAA